MEKDQTITRGFSPSSPLALGFLGLGLIGGSIAKTARRVFPNCQIFAFDPDEKALDSAVKDGIVTTALHTVNEQLKACDYLFLCAPVHYNIEYLPKLKTIVSDDCIITDVGSVKTEIHEAILLSGLDEQFIGGHPMVGSEKSGYFASRDRLIENAYYFITPSSSISEQKISLFFAFIQQLGAIPIRFTPEYHDWITSAISHVPHVVASSLVNLAQKEDTPDGLFKKLAAGGFKDITRIASSSPTVWQHILLSNSKNIVDQLSDFQQMIEQVKQAIIAKNDKMLYDFFKTARDYRDSLPEGGVGVIRKNHEIYLDVADQPGMLAIVTTLLGSNGISIKNIGIIHSREYEEGALKVAFYDEKSVYQAADIFEKYNFTVYKR